MVDEKPRLISPETYVLTHSRFNTYLANIFSDLNKTEIYKMPYRDSPHNEIEIPMSSDYLSVFQPNGHTEDYHIGKPNDDFFLFEIRDEKYIFVGEKKLLLKQMI